MRESDLNAPIKFYILGAFESINARNVERYAKTKQQRMTIWI